ncbi:MAG: spore cortex-lytic enzyme [Clostridia bacterium]|nr:spore cortex-lytic enzyme [Clostridia bacterium]
MKTNKKRIIISLVLVLSLVTAFLLNGSNAAALSKYGSSGSEVTQIQQKLQSLGFYSGSIDGVYGTETKKAVTEFQKSCGLTADGIAGTKTLTYLGLSSSSSSNSYGFTQSEVELLARTISAESRGEPYEGQVAVGAVILNRIEHPSFPNTMAGVIYQNGAFSCIDDGQINEPVYESSKRAAVDAMNGWDPSGGAIYYYNPVTATNKWIRSRPIIVTIGKHVFCS